MAHNEQNIPSEWIRPGCRPGNKTHGFICTKNGNVLFHVLNDYSYPVMLRELAFRVDFLSARIKDLEQMPNGQSKIRGLNDGGHGI